MIYGIPTTKKEKILMKMYNIDKEISSIKTHGGTWEFNLTTGETEFIGPELSDKDKQKVEDLKAEMKQLEVELKVAELEEDFNENNKEKE